MNKRADERRGKREQEEREREIDEQTQKRNGEVERCRVQRMLRVDSLPNRLHLGK